MTDPADFEFHIVEMEFKIAKSAMDEAMAALRDWAKAIDVLTAERDNALLRIEELERQVNDSCGCLGYTAYGKLE